MRLAICLGLLTLFVVSLSSVGHVCCQDESKIVGKPGNAELVYRWYYPQYAPTDTQMLSAAADILEVDFQLLENGSLFIRYLTSGSFQRPEYFERGQAVYNLYFYDNEDTTSLNDRYFAYISIGLSEYWDSCNFYYGSNRSKSGWCKVNGSEITITNLLLKDIGDRYIFYASAESYISRSRPPIGTDPMGFSLSYEDVEPRTPSGNLTESERHHAVIKLNVPLSIYLVKDASITIDGLSYTADNDRNLQFKILAGRHTFSIDSVTFVRSGERLLFKQWEDDSTQPERAAYLAKPTKFSPTFVRQYFLNLTTPDSQIGASGWYEAGRIISIPSYVPFNGFLGIIGGNWVLDYWEGDSGTKASSTVRMDSPKLAKYRGDYTIPIIVFLAGITSGALFTAGRVLPGREKARSKTESTIGTDLSVMKEKTERKAPTTSEATGGEKTTFKHVLIIECEQLSAELRETEQKIINLTDSYASRRVPEKTYDVLLADYEKRCASLRKMIDEAKDQIKEETNSIREEMVRIKKEVELLKAKHTVDDISEEEYTAKTSDLDAKYDELKEKQSSLILYER